MSNDTIRRGGRRPGAGRKPTDDKRVSVTIRISQDTSMRLRCLRREASHWEGLWMTWLREHTTTCSSSLYGYKITSITAQQGSTCWAVIRVYIQVTRVLPSTRATD